MTARVEKFQYRAYRFKEFAPRWKRILSTSWVNFLYQWKRSTGVKIVIVIVVILELIIVWSVVNLLSALSLSGIETPHMRFFIVNFSLPINTFLGGIQVVDPSNTPNPRLFLNFSLPLGIFSILAIILIGAGLFSDDNQYRVIELYLTKMDRTDYIISKYLALLIPSVLVFALPPLITTMFAMTSYTAFSLIDAIQLLTAQLIYQLGISIFMTSVILLASAYSSRRAYAGLFVFFLLFFLSFSTSMALGSQGSLPTTTISDVEWLVLIDPFLAFQTWGAFLFGYDQVILIPFKSTAILDLNDGNGVEWWHPIIELILLMAVSWLLTVREMLKKLEEVAH